jgi:hypothetical protein
VKMAVSCRVAIIGTAARAQPRHCRVWLLPH